MGDEDAADRDIQSIVEFMEYIAEAARRLAHRGGGRAALPREVSMKGNLAPAPRSFFMVARRSQSQQ
jgi:hypothetical protein